MPRNPTLAPRAILPSDACAGWVGPPPAISRRNYKSLKDPVRGAGSAQMQTQSYHALCKRGMIIVVSKLLLLITL